MRNIRLHPHARPLATALALLVSAAACPAQAVSIDDLQEIIRDQQARIDSLEASLIEAKKAEKHASTQLEQVRERLRALGRNLLDGGDDRLVQAAADLQVAGERLNRLESASLRLASAIQEYLRQAVVSDPDARVNVESSLRELDLVLGLRQKPRPDVRLGNLQQARVVSLDQESGLLVLNLGENQGARIGMSFRLFRGQQAIGQATIADVRSNVSGAFVDSLDAGAESARPGDLANLLTE